MVKKFSLALVTGATSGIGEALSRLLASQGIDLIITGRNISKLEELATELGTKVHVDCFSADLASQDDRQKVIRKIYEKIPDLVINNAGFGLYGPALTHTTASQLEILNVNGNAVLEITMEAARALATRSKAGTIMNIASAAAFQVFPELAIYSAAKTFVVQFSQALNIELKSQGIQVLAACPGMVATDFSRRAAKEKEPFLLTSAISSEEAAKHIWDQIQSANPVYIFDWKTRWMTYLSRIAPKCIVAMVLRSKIRRRTPDRPII